MKRNKGGRPSKYTPELVQEIATRMSGGEPLAPICRDIGIDPSTVRDWMAAREDVKMQIARARADGFDAIACRARETARGMGDSKGDVARDKLIIETDLKLLAKWDPKRYGDMIRQELTGKDGGPIETKYQGYSDKELDRLIAQKMAEIKR